MKKYVIIGPIEGHRLDIEANCYEINENGCLTFADDSGTPFMSINPNSWAVVMENEDDL